MERSQIGRNADARVDVACLIQTGARRVGLPFEELAAVSGRSLTLSDGDEPERFNGATITWNMFPMIGIEPMLGRQIRHDEDTPGGPRVVLLSHGVWQRRYGADPSVIGAHFLVSEYRPGVVVWDHVPAELAIGPDPGRRIGFAVVDALADLHLVDVEACGLSDLGRPDGYLERQLRGWQRRWDAVALDGGNGTLDQVGRLLARHLPASGAPALVHNDFKVDNCQFSAGCPDEVVSVFDWDMATIGDPLTDLGTLLNYWPDGDTPADGVPGAERVGLPLRDEVVARYAARTGRHLTRPDVAWYEAFGCWKTAVILQQLYVRHLRGESTDERMAARGAQVGRIGERALALAETLGS